MKRDKVLPCPACRHPKSTLLESDTVRACNNIMCCFKCHVADWPRLSLAVQAADAYDEFENAKAMELEPMCRAKRKLDAAYLKYVKAKEAQDGH